MRAHINLLQKVIMVSLLLSALFLSTHAEKITTTVGTNNTDWSITRQSDSIKFDYSQYVQGSISPVEYRGRSLEPYHSSYEEVDVNDVRLRERTSARRGDYASEGLILLRADSLPSSCPQKRHIIASRCPPPASPTSNMAFPAPMPS